MHADFPKTWQGHWIWVQDPSVTQGNPISPDRRERPPALALFRKTFSLSTLPAQMPARLTADSRYRLSVNGTVLGLGPLRSQPRRLTYDRYDLAPYLVEGENVIALEVRYYGRANSFWMPAVGNATLGRSGMAVFEANYSSEGQTEWIVSDDTWRGQLCSGARDDAHDPNASLVGGGVPAESFDARGRAPGWNLQGFDDSAWGFAHKITPIHMGGPGRSQPPGDPYGALSAHSLRAPIPTTLAPRSISLAQSDSPIDISVAAPAARVEASALGGLGDDPHDIALPFHISPKGHARVMLDMGRLVAGYPSFDIDAPAGATFDLAYVEDPITAPAHFGAHGGTRYVARGQDDRFTAFDRQGFRYAILISDAPFTLKSFTCTERLYPWVGDYGFSSSNPLFDRLFKAAIRTVAVNSWDCFIDCPSREQRAWAGDSVVHLMTHLVANGDWELCWRNLALCASPRADGLLPMSAAGDVEFGEGFTIPDWSLHWLHGLYMTYRYSGDTERVRGFMPVAEGILRWFLPYLGKDGLLHDVTEWNLVDWSALFSQGTSAPVNGLWARGLNEFAQMARAMGDQGRADWAQALHEDLRQGFEVFWDEARGIYVDHLIAGVQRPEANQISTAIAITAELAPPSRQRRAARAMCENLVERSWLFAQKGEASDMGARFRSVITSRFTPDWDVTREVVAAQPFMSYVVHEALARAGQGALLAEQLARWDRFLQDGFDTFGERWNGGSRAHGWSATPARDLIAHIAGITPAGPGFSSLRVAPLLGDLSALDVRVPTAHGPVRLTLAHNQLTLHSPVPVDLIAPRDGWGTISVTCHAPEPEQ